MKEGYIMIKIAHVEEAISLVQSNLPKEVVNVVISIATILDAEYGKNRNVDGSNGGYILIVESYLELEKLKDIYVDINNDIPEYVDKIEVNDSESYYNILFLCNSDFSISLILPSSIITKRLLSWSDSN